MMITQTTRDNAAILSLVGRLDFNARHDFQAAVEKAKATGVHLIVAHLKDVSFIDSAALGLLTVAYKNLEAAKIRLVVAEPQDYVRKIFSLANLGNLIKVYATVDDAVSSRTSFASFSK
ncbi:MAG: STAS domain-containing protein [Nitrospirales bacterium]|nr:STAS domain-containing protein [Nitrospira sp.]MDR4500521.1 STAS domain-containing protein [Nitrospirales bacterium]